MVAEEALWNNSFSYY